jgi:hypothetical protein
MVWSEDETGRPVIYLYRNREYDWSKHAELPGYKERAECGFPIAFNEVKDNQLGYQQVRAMPRHLAFQLQRDYRMCDTELFGEMEVELDIHGTIGADAIRMLGYSVTAQLDPGIRVRST